jgi:hypothetical protein
MIEFVLVLLPLLGFMALILNLGWTVFLNSTLQNAVAQGARYAVTGNTVNGWCQTSSIQFWVQQGALGQLGATAGSPPAAARQSPWNGISVDWYMVNADGSLTNEDGVAGGNGCIQDGQCPLVKVSAQSPGTLLVQFIPMPGMGLMKGIGLGVAAWDRMEPPVLGNLANVPCQ